jgi:isopenicillin-N N-acyltransferase-like protein
MYKPHNLKKEAPGCTALAQTGYDENRRPLLALGQNWDWSPRFINSVVILRLEPDKAPKLVTFTEAGMIGKIGFNEHRLGVCLNFLWHPSNNPYRKFGIPIHCLLRSIMACTTLEEAYKQIAWMPRCASANFMLAQHRVNHSLEAMSLELTPDAIARLPLERNSLIHTNHYLSNALVASNETQTNASAISSTISRYQMAEEAVHTLRKQDPDPVSRMKQILALGEGALPISRSLNKKNASNGTVAGIIMDLSRNDLFLTAGPPHETEWVTCLGVK